MCQIKLLQLNIKKYKQIKVNNKTNDNNFVQNQDRWTWQFFMTMRRSPKFEITEINVENGNAHEKVLHFSVLSIGWFAFLSNSSSYLSNIQWLKTEEEVIPKKISFHYFHFISMLGWLGTFFAPFGEPIKAMWSTPTTNKIVSYLQTANTLCRWAWWDRTFEKAAKYGRKKCLL
jgi:hypothetical protein